jgi:hypothetical protein
MGQEISVGTCPTCRVAMRHVRFLVADICKDGLGVITNVTGGEAYRGKVVIGYKVEAILIMSKMELGTESDGGGGAGLLLSWYGEGAEGVFYGWWANQPWSFSSRIAGSWFVLTASSKRGKNSC